MLDAGASRVFAVADHQIAHVYLNDRFIENKVRDLLETEPRRRAQSWIRKQQAGLGH